MDQHWMYAMDTHGETPATRARKSGYTVLAELLLSQERADTMQQTAQTTVTPEGEAYWGMGHSAHQLLKDEPTPQKTSTEIDLLLHEAARNGDVDRAKELLINGADVDQANDQGLTPLHWSALSGRSDIAALLLDHGADVNARECYTGKLTPMAVALLMGYDDLVELMAARGGVC